MSFCCFFVDELTCVWQDFAALISFSLFLVYFYCLYCHFGEIKLNIYIPLTRHLKN